MSTPRTHSRVSLASRAALLALSLAVVGCAGSASRPASHPARSEPAPSEATPLAIRFDNEARDHADVYLLGEQREWRLGRVAPGARARLRIPAAALGGDAWSLRLAVVTGERTTLRAAGDHGATITTAHTASDILGQRWTFSQTPTRGRLVSMRPVGVRVER